MIFASRTIVEHVVRGLVGLGALAGAVAMGDTYPLVAVALLPLALLSLRGCPACWTFGLIATIAAKVGRRPQPDVCLDGRCAHSDSDRTRDRT